MSKPEDEPLLDIARGDPARSRFLRGSLKKLRESSTNEQFCAMIDDILAGKRSLRSAAISELFNSEVIDNVHQGVQRYNQLSEQEKDDLAEEGQRQFQKLREEDLLEETTKRRKDRDDTDNDDDDFGGSVLKSGW